MSKLLHRVYVSKNRKRAHMRAATTPLVPVVYIYIKQTTRLAMPRFTDEWVVDRTVFEFVNGGSCACCGFSHFFPSVESMITSISDLETDAAQAEISAYSPWPPEMREQVWADRIRLRQKMRKEMDVYREFWEQHGEQFSAWCKSHLQLMKKLLQMPRSEVTEKFKTQYGIHSAFGIVICAVTEQVANYCLTGYPSDAVGEAESSFEKLLVLDRRGGLTMKIVGQDGTVDEEALQVLLNRIQSLGGPKLLERGVSKSEEGGVDDGVQEGQKGPSFRSDRRIVRLIVARYWADALRTKYLKDVHKGTE